MSTKTETKQKSESTILFLRVIKALFVALIITFASIILFAFIIKWAGLSDGVITPVNLVIKGLSVFLGVLTLTRKSSRGLIKGIVFAILYTIIAFVVFSCLAGTLILNLGILTDFAFNILVGAISGICFTNKGK